MGLSGMQSRLLMVKSQKTDTTKMQDVSWDTLNKLKDKMAAEEKKGGDTSKVQSEYNKEQVNYKDLDAKMNELDSQYASLLAQIESEEKKNSSFMG